MTTSIIIHSTDSSGDKKQRSVTNINPNATANQLIEFAGKFTALSNHTYVSTVRVDRTELTWTEAANNG